MKWLIAPALLILGFAAGILSRSSQAPHPFAPVAAQASRAAEPQPRATDPVAEIRAVLREKASLRQFAALRELLGRLTAGQMGALFEGLEWDSRLGFSDSYARELFPWWLEHDPEAASAWALRRLERLAQDGAIAPFDFFSFELVQQWAKAFPERALDFARAHARSPMVGELLANALAQWRDRPRSETWALLRDFPEGEARATVAANFLREWAAKDSGAALAAAEALPPGRTREAALARVLPEIAAQDPAAAFAHYTRLGLADSSLLSAMVAGAAQKDPVAVADWLLQLDRPHFGLAAPALVEKWAARDPVTALNWGLEHQVQLWVLRDSNTVISFSGLNSSSTVHTGGGGANALSAAMQAKPAETVAWLRALPAGETRDLLAERLLSFAPAEQAVQLFGELPPAAAERAAAGIVYKFEDKPARAVAWAETLPAGASRTAAWRTIGTSSETELAPPPAAADRDAWLSGRIYNRRQTPEESLDLIQQVSDPAKRHEVFDAAMRYRLDQPVNKDRALAWMEKANVPVEWKSKWQGK